ncbi:MAG: 3-deoxy-7-phosphoheptulonate synthase [Candidatus Micrarchaeota archaeon]
MIIVMKPEATKEEIEHVKSVVEKHGLGIHKLSRGVKQTVIGLVGNTRAISEKQFEILDGVEEVVRVQKAYKLASREFQKENTMVEVDGVKIGGEEIVVIAGPCAVESRDQFLEAALAVKKSGAKILRGSIFKPRTSPYDFQGIGTDGLKLLEEARDATGLLIETEVMHPEHVRMVAPYVDMLRIGARNMQNFDLLKQVGRSEKPAILKRGLSATIHEFLMAAEYILSEGNPNVILCERGIRTFVTETRNTLDLNAVPLVKSLTHLPIIVDPSHGTGKYELVEPMSMASIAAGADGLMIEVHPRPEEALSDGPQQLTPKRFGVLMQNCRKVAEAVGRRM